MGILENETDFNKYKAFYAVAEYGSFSKAAENLFISQPAISHSIKELESQLDTKLFIRDNKNVILTEDGEKLLYYVKKAFNNLLLGESILKEKKDDLSGNIRIGIYSHISLFMLPKIIKVFSNIYPNVKFYIYSSSNQEMLEKLRNKELDLVILQYPIFIVENNFTEEIIAELDTCFFANKEVKEAYLSSNYTLKDFSLILPMRGYPDINHLEETLKSHKIIFNNNITCYNTELAISLVKEGIGIGYGIKKCIENEKEVYSLPVDFDTPKTKFSIAYDEKFLSPTIIKFINYLKKEIKKDFYN